MKKWLLLFSLLLCSCSSSAPSNPKTDVKYVTFNKVVIRDCGKNPCGFSMLYTVDKEKGTAKVYESISVLNPETQDFQARFYTTDSYTWGLGGGIAYLDDDEYLRISDNSSQAVITVDNITDEYSKEYGSWYRASLVYDLLIVIGIPVGFLIVMAFVLSFINGLGEMAKAGHDFLDTKEGKKLLKNIDKNMRNKH